MTKTSSSGGNLGSIEPHIVPLKIKHPNLGKFVGLTINLRWFGSEPVKIVQRGITDKRLKLAQRRKDLNAEQLDETTYDQLIAAIDSWEWGISDIDGMPANIDGEQPVFNAVNAKKVFKRFGWIVTQCDEKLAEDEAFF